jgi:hypothetical protein
VTEQQRDDINKLLALATYRLKHWETDPVKYETVLIIYPPVIERMKKMMGWKE